MSDWPGGPMPPIISSLSRYAIGLHMLGINGSFVGAAAWPSNNRGIYVPFGIQAPFRITRFFTANTTASGNIDVGVYGSDGSLLLSKGSTAMSGTTLQFLTPTEMVLQPGNYYMAMSCSTTAASFSASPLSVLNCHACGVLQAVTQLPLATGPTFATAASAYVPLFGISSISGF